jgi:hypothetical protein
LTDYALWLVFAALGSVLLLATTSHITQNIASVPFLWVLPLSLYLLTFVVAFEGRQGRGWYQRTWFLFPTLLLLVAMAAGLSANRGVLDVGLAVPLYTIGMMMAAFFCNGELALSKPVPRYLTQFYLTISLGGALGGMLVGLVAPRVFPTYFELPVALVLLASLAVLVARKTRWLIGPAIAGDRMVPAANTSDSCAMKSCTCIATFTASLRVKEVDRRPSRYAGYCIASSCTASSRRSMRTGSSPARTTPHIRGRPRDRSKAE